MRAVFLVGLFVSTTALAQDPIINFDGSDNAMNAAIAAAQGSFDGFWERTADADGVSGEGASIKVSAPHDDGNEHIWMGPCKKLDEVQFVCIVGNEPVYVKTQRGEPYECTREQISDWMIARADGKIEGAYTLRVMLPQLPKDQAEDFRARLLPLPTE